MQVVVSLLVLVVGLLILTSPHRIFPSGFDESTKRWAAGWIGAVIGYWLS
jgi:VanZ family protein